MNFNIFISTTALLSYLVVAAPNPIAADGAADSTPAISLPPLNLTAYDCKPNDQNCAAKRSLEKRIFSCPQGYEYGGSYCTNQVTRVDVCASTEPGNDEELAYPQECPAGMICLLQPGHPPHATCAPPANAMQWPFHYPSDFKKISSQDRNTPTKIINNYYGPNGAPIKVAYTGFIGQPGGQNDGATFGAEAAASLPINWNYDDTVLVDIEETSTTAGINVVTFLSL